MNLYKNCTTLSYSFYVHDTTLALDNLLITHLIDEKKLLFNGSQLIEQAKFLYSAVGKAFEKQTKTIEFQRRKHVQANNKQLKSIKDLFPQTILNTETKKWNWQN